MKRLITITFIYLCMQSSFAQEISFSNVKKAKLSSAKWGSLRQTNSTLRISKMMDGVFSLSITGDEKCDTIIQFSEIYDGTYYYEAMGMMNSYWCDDGIHSVMTAIKIEEIIEDRRGTINIFFDKENAVAYKVD